MLNNSADQALASGRTHTHVYLREVQSKENDSLSKIVALIANGNTVLDVGTGSGALGRALASYPGVVVDGITYNEEECVLARPHYRELAVMDLESQPLPERLAEARYDVIVCADVLEHLRNATDVLYALRARLKPGGVVLLSLPNVTHLGVILGLMAGRFVRTREGLLDATHVHFMDRTALDDMVRAAGFTVTKEDAVRRNLVDTEFASLDLQALPQGVRSYVSALPDAEIYQFVWTLAPNEVGGASAEVLDRVPAQPPATPVIDQVPWFRAQLYLDSGNGFSEAGGVEAFGMQQEGLQTITFAIDGRFDTQALRLDFSDRPGQLEFVSLVAKDRQGNTVWRWNGDWASNQTYHQCDWTGVRGWFGGRVVRATGTDPWVSIPLQAGQWAEVHQVELCISSPQASVHTDWPGLNVRQLQETLTGMSANIDALHGQAAQRIVEMELAWKSSLRNAKEELDALQRVVLLHRTQLEAMLKSRSWRVTAGLRWVSRLLSRGARS